jgi:hypothetical protein
MPTVAVVNAWPIRIVASVSLRSLAFISAGIRLLGDRVDAAAVATQFGILPLRVSEQKGYIHFCSVTEGYNSMNPDPSPATRFQAGQSGNPAGRPRGARNKASLVAEEVMAEHVEAITRAQCQKALEGSERAQRFVIGRLAAPARQRPVTLDPPETVTLEGLLEAHESLTRAFAAGELTPEEARAGVDLLEGHRRALELGALARRLEAVEAELGLPPG